MVRRGLCVPWIVTHLLSHEADGVLRGKFMVSLLVVFRSKHTDFRDFQSKSKFLSVASGGFGFCSVILCVNYEVGSTISAYCWALQWVGHP
jgi:hypothetical protein